MEDLTEEEMIKDKEYREVYTHENNKIDFSKLRPTDVKSNPRVCMPKPGSDEQEAEINCREILTDKVIEEYIASQARNSSLTKSEQEGMERLLSRIEAREIIIYPTDKSGKLAVTTFENYHKQGEKHVKSDEKIGWLEVNKIMNTVKGHLRALNKIFNTGASHSKRSKERAWRAKEAMATIVPNMYIFLKDHKAVRDDG